MDNPSASLDPGPAGTLESPAEEPEGVAASAEGASGDAEGEGAPEGFRQPRTATLSRLRIAGFKSFAEATTVEVLPGLTGIVGPNGCGKSNVVEALRWAMGETNARAMRGGEMTTSSSPVLPPAPAGTRPR